MDDEDRRNRAGDFEEAVELVLRELEAAGMEERLDERARAWLVGRIAEDDCRIGVARLVDHRAEGGRGVPG